MNHPSSLTPEENIMTIASTLRKINNDTLVPLVEDAVGRQCRQPKLNEIGDLYLSKVVQVFIEQLPKDDADIKLHIRKRDDGKWGLIVDSVLPYHIENAAISLGLLNWPWRPESNAEITAGRVLVDQLKVYTEALVTVLCREAVSAYENRVEPTYLALINTPGYLPEDEPVEFETIAEAWTYLAEERRGDEDNVEGTDGYSEIAAKLAEMAEAANPQCSAVYGPTPGYDGDHDLGVVYTVTIKQD
jgi:hypothetical protein